MAIIKFAEDVDMKVTLDFDQPRVVEGDYGTQYQYGCGNGDDIFYASQSLHAMIELTGVKKGDEITIRKCKGQDEKTGKTFLYFKVNGKSMDELGPNNALSGSPVGAGFVQKDAKNRDYSNLTLAYLDERIRVLESAMTKLEEKVEAGTTEKSELPF